MRSEIYTRTFVRLLYPYHGSLDFLAPEYIALDSHVYLDTIRRGIIIHFVALTSTWSIKGIQTPSNAGSWPGGPFAKTEGLASALMSQVVRLCSIVWAGSVSGQLAWRSFMVILRTKPSPQDTVVFANAHVCLAYSHPIQWQFPVTSLSRTPEGVTPLAMAPLLGTPYAESASHSVKV